MPLGTYPLVSHTGIGGVQLDAEPVTTMPFGGYGRRAGAHERIEHHAGNAWNVTGASRLQFARGEQSVMLALKSVLLRRSAGWTDSFGATGEDGAFS